MPQICKAQLDGMSSAACGLELEHRPSPPPHLNWAVVSQNRTSKVLFSEFTSEVPSDYPKNQTVPIWVYLPAQAEPSSKTFHFVLILHYLGAINLDAEESMAHRMNERGIAAVLIALPYHLSRTPVGFRSGQLAVVPNSNAIIHTMIQSVWDSREAIMAAEQLPELNSRKVGIAGISLGSVIAEDLFGIDLNIDHAAFILGGCDLAGTLWKSDAVVGVKYRFMHDGITLNDLRSSLASVEPSFYLKGRGKIDPVPHSALVVTAEFDQVIPRASSDLLIDSLVDPDIIRIDTGHYGGAFVQSRLETEVANYFSKVDEDQSFVPPKVINAPTLRLAAQAMEGTGFDIGVGVDLFRTHSRLPFFGDFVVTPRGVELFAGQSIGNGISIGAVGGTRGIGFGIFWSSIL